MIKRFFFLFVQLYISQAQANGIIKCVDENQKIVYTTTQDVQKSKKKLKCENAKLSAISIYTKGEKMDNSLNLNQIKLSKKEDNKLSALQVQIPNQLQTIDSALSMTQDPEEKKILQDLKESHLQNSMSQQVNVQMIAPDVKSLKGKLPTSIP